MQAHLRIAWRGVAVGITVTAAKVDERDAAYDVLSAIEGLVLGDKGCIRPQRKADCEALGINLQPPVRRNMQEPRPRWGLKWLRRVRQRIETLFGGLKTRGFNFEDTHLRDAARRSKMMGLLALAFAWTHRTGEGLHDRDRPIPLKKTLRRPLKSLFRHGLDCLRNIALNLAEKFQDFRWALKFLSCT